METAQMTGVMRVRNPIEKLIRERNLTPATLAKVVGRAASTVSAMRRGELAGISDEVARRIEEVFNIPAEELQRDYRCWLEEQEEKLRRSLKEEGGDEDQD